MTRRDNKNSTQNQSNGNHEAHNNDPLTQQQQSEQNETTEPQDSDGMMSYFRRLSRNAGKVWAEITTSTSDERPALVVNPHHHLRSHSIGSYHTPSVGDQDSIIEAFTEAAFGTTDNNNSNIMEPLLLNDGGSTGSGPISDSLEAMVVQSPIPPPLPMRERSTSGAFLSTETRIWAREMIRRAGNYLAYTTLLIMLCVVPVVTYHGLRLRRVDSAAFRSAGVMCVGTIVLSLRLVYLHLTHWYMPEVQKYVVRILWMVPLYSIQSWLSLRFHESRIYIDTIRDYYEAYVIASFVYYLIELLGGEAALIQILQAKASTQEATKLGKHSFPLSLVLEDWVLGEDFMLNCKHGVLQYVVFKSISAFVTFICESAGVYGEGTFTWLSAYPYLAFFQNFSVMYALYSLVMLYSAVHEELRYPINWRPLGKFLCVKGVVFFTWWQGVVIYYLKAHGIIDHLGSWSSEDVANGLIDYCVVIEMVGFAIAHSYTFTYKEYLPSNIPSEFRNMTAESLAAPFVDENGVQSPSDTTFEPQILANGDGLLAGNMGEKRHYARAESASEDGREMYQQQPEPSPISPIMGQRTTTYHPPALLDQPMDFRDAFWSSAVPKDTIQDIQRLRIAGKFEAALRPRVFSSSQESGEASGENNEENETDTEEGREDKQAPLQNEGEEEEKASEVDDSEAGSKLDEDTAGTGNQPNESYDLGEQSDQQPPIE